MTLVFGTKLRSLIQVQLRTADVVNVVSAAYSVYGWLGGLAGAKVLLSMPNSFSQRTRWLLDEKGVNLAPITIQVLTGDGPRLIPLHDADEAFEGDPRTQFLGLTLCALAHEMEGAVAVTLLKLCMLDIIFEGSDEFASALYSQLNDASHMQQILNEGAARGLTNTFISATAALDIAEGDREWLRVKCKGDDSLPPFTEVHLVGGMLKWVVSEDTTPYFTRSALVARVAVCLKCIGYSRGDIRTWNGTKTYPTTEFERNTLVLILGGSCPTDRLMLDAEDIACDQRIFHYQYNTVGAMLLNALGNQWDMYPEVLQDQFDSIYTYMESAANFEYRESSAIAAYVEAKFCQVTPSATSTSIERRFAAMYFPLSAEFLAPCYRSIANQDNLRQIKDHDARYGSFHHIPEAVCHFRAITASIVISIVSRLGADGFKKCQHGISLDLSNPDWLGHMCKALDQAIGSGLDYHQAVSALAVIHSAHDPEKAFRSRKSIVAWRNGIYSVVPSLLLSMKASSSAVLPHCIDQYWANVKVREDGSIDSARTPSMHEQKDLFGETPEEHASTLQHLSRPWLGPLQPGSPDVSLYITFERPLHNNHPDLCLVGRIDGRVVGSTGILDVLRGLLRNAHEPDQCPGHPSPSAVVNVRASQWASCRTRKPVGESIHTFVPVQHDDCWAIFVLGQSCYFNGYLSLRCAECTVERAGSRSVVIGYGQSGLAPGNAVSTSLRH